MIENPWPALPLAAPYVLEEDRISVEKYNETCKAEGLINDESYRLRTNLLPDPFIGNTNAPVVFLSANPGYTDEVRAAKWKCDSDDVAHQNPAVQQLYRDNYAQAEMEFPFFFLDPRMERTPAGRWCRQHFLRALLEEAGDDRLIASKIALIDSFPYHSARYRFIKAGVPSQEYSRQLVSQAMSRNATIVVMRSRKPLEDAIPKLRDYDYIHASSEQTPAASPGNLVSKDGAKNGFERIRKAISG